MLARREIPRAVCASQRLEYIDSAALCERSIRDAFESGAAAVVVQGDPLAHEAWRTLVDSPSLDGAPAQDETLPWNGNIRDLAANFREHASMEEELGDVVYNQPGRLNYIARKVRLTHEHDSAHVQCDPPTFFQNGQPRPLAQSGMELAWHLGQKIASGMGLRGWSGSIDMHRLFYEANAGALRRRRRMLVKALETPNARRFSRLLPSALRKRIQPPTESSEPSMLVGEPHTDGRLATALVSMRGLHSTEVFVDERWLELPFDNYNIVVLPGRGCEQLGIAPTIHRVVRNKQSRRDGDVTLVLGIPADAAHAA